MEQFPLMSTSPQETLKNRLVEAFSISRLEDFGDRGLNSKFYGVKGRNDLIVRASEGVRPETQRLTEAKVAFKDLESRGVAVVPTEYVLDKKKDEEGLVVYAISERLNGESLERMQVFSPELGSELDTFYTGYVSHLEAAYNKKGQYVFDFHYLQCMQGKRPDSEESKLYFIDVEPFLGTFAPEELQEENPPTTPERKFVSVLRRVAQQIVQIEQKIVDGAKLRKTREALNLLLEGLPKEDMFIADRVALTYEVLG